MTLPWRTALVHSRSYHWELRKKVTNPKALLASIEYILISMYSNELLAISIVHSYPTLVLLSLYTKLSWMLSSQCTNIHLPNLRPIQNRARTEFESTAYSRFILYCNLIMNGGTSQGYWYILRSILSECTTNKSTFVSYRTGSYDIHINPVLATTDSDMQPSPKQNHELPNGLLFTLYSVDTNINKLFEQDMHKPK